MALIPITFKADIPNGKKGDIRAEDFSTLISFLYPNKAGVLNITGQDCSAFGSINVVGNTAQITFHKGYIVIYGRAIYVEEGTQVAFNLPISEVNGVLGVKINLAENGTNEVTWFQKTTTPQTDDLLSNDANGVYEFVLYNYTATSNSFVLGEKTNEIIDNIDNKFVDRVALLDIIGNTITGSNKASGSIQINGITIRPTFQYPDTDHKWHEFTIRNYRIIVGKVIDMRIEGEYAVSWGSDRFLSSDYIIVPSFTTDTRNADKMLKYPVYAKNQYKNGFVFYNVNDYWVNGTYIAIGKYKE